MLETVTLHVFYPLADLVKGKKTIRMEWEGGTLAELIDELATRYGRAIKEELLGDNGGLNGGYVMVVDGHRAKDLQARLRNAADITVLTPIPGG